MMKPWGLIGLMTLLALVLVSCGSGGIDGTYENDLESFEPPDLPFLKQLFQTVHNQIESATMTIEGEKIRLRLRAKNGEEQVIKGELKNRTETSFQIVVDGESFSDDPIRILEHGVLECADCFKGGLGRHWVQR